MTAIIQSETEIANRALQYTGGKALVNVWTDTGKNATEIQNAYHMVRRAELRRNVWRFAIRNIAIRALVFTTLGLITSRTITFGTWAVGTSYAVGDIVLGSDGVTYQSKTSSNLAHDPSNHDFTNWRRYHGGNTAFEFVTTWSSTIAYATGMHTVGSNGSIYIALSATTNNNPVSDGGVHWAVTTDGTMQTSSTGTSATTFYAGEMVYVGANVYMSLISGNANVPTTDTTGSWLLMTTTPTLSQIIIPYPLSFGPQSTLSKRGAYPLPVGFQREAPQAPKQGSQPWLGSPTNLGYTDWQYEAGFFLSNYTSPIVFRFVADIDNPAEFDAMFCEGLACRIALSISQPTTQNSALRQEILGLYKGFITEARLVNGIETGPIEASLSKYMAVRY